MITRRDLLAGTLASALQARPNIVWIMLDDLGSGDVGPYGQTKIKTPHIDKLAKQSMLFTDCYAGASVCAPSRSVLMTGLHTGHTPIRGNAGTIPLQPQDKTVAQSLQAAGYTTGLFGKWGLGDSGSSGEPSKKGFAESFGYLHQIHAHNYYTDFLWHNGRKVPLDKGQYSADIIAEKSFDFVRAKGGKPFFLYAAYTLPHGKFEVPDTGEYAKEDWPQVEKNFAAMITRADRHIGTLLKRLDDLKLSDNTVVFFTSDNGGPSGEAHSAPFFRSNGSLRGQKGQLYEGGLRVPMLVRWPGKVKPSTRSSVPWSSCDFFPTAAEIAGFPLPPGLDGISMVPVFTGKSPSPDARLLYWEQYAYDRRANDLRKDTLAQAGRHGEWKAIRAQPGAALELYNLREDGAESKNVAEAHPDIVAKMNSLLDKAHSEPRPHNTGNFEFVR